MEINVRHPIAEEIAPGVFRLVLPLPWPIRGINLYVVRHGGTCTIVDTGVSSPESFERFEAGLRYLGIPLRQIAQIVVTHSHTDHVGLAGRIQELSGGWLILHKVEADLLVQRYVDPETPTCIIRAFLARYGVSQATLDRFLLGSTAHRAYYTPARPDVLVHGGEAIDAGQSSLRVIWTPGHSPGHCCFYDVERRVLFSGDHVLAGITPNVGRHPLQGEYPLLDYERSLQQLMELDVALTLPGHGPVIADLRAHGIQLLESHQRRRERCVAAVRAGVDTLEAIAGEVFGNERAAWEKRSALVETLSHLDALVVEGRLQSCEENGVIHFALVPVPAYYSGVRRG